MDVTELNELLSNHENGLPENILFLDVRTTGEYQRGFIEQSSNVPLHLIPMKIHELKEAEKVIIYCQTGARSAQACAYLSQNGVDNAYNVRGGIVTWAQMGYPISG
ncbi:MAG: rhodanese-like domain-containing protein [Gammaproteobacteria bacterium]|nr:rhodanese-like domain-containing protein [Gammaproteobacteria bacterium]